MKYITKCKFKKATHVYSDIVYCLGGTSKDIQILPSNSKFMIFELVLFILWTKNSVFIV